VLHTLQRIELEAGPAGRSASSKELNEALKFYRHLAEERGRTFGQDQPELFLDMEQQVLEIEKPEHGEGELFWFPNPPTLAPFNWRHLLMKLSPNDREQVVGSGVVTVGLYTTPGSYDHKLCNRLSSNNTDPRGSGVQGAHRRVADFKITNNDGRSWLLHPSRQGKMVPRMMQRNLQAPTLPKRGVGHSDGPNTFRRLTQEVGERPIPPPPAREPPQ